MTGLAGAGHPPWVLDHAPYTPFMEARTAKPPGLSPLDMASWTVRDPDFDPQMIRRREVMAAHIDVVLSALTEGEDPALELLSMLKANLGQDPAPTELETYCPLTAIGHMVSEDFCLMRHDPNSGEYRLVSAILCFPSRWLLAEKMGRPLTVIHQPVPDYDDVLARRVARVFDAVKPDRPLVRVNWLVHAVPELFLPLGLSDKLMQQAPSAGPFYLRTERQTLVRLPQTGAVAFGIKTSVTPIDRLTPEQATALHGALGKLAPEDVAYRSGGRLIDAARTVLAKVAAR
ncbi:MAG: DUF3445 domain-containing protein [Pseudomonadota bacterium]